MYEPRTYQVLVPVAPVGVSDFECARVLVWREGWGWVERPITPEVVGDECEGAA